MPIFDADVNETTVRRTSEAAAADGVRQAALVVGDALALGAVPAVVAVHSDQGDPHLLARETHWLPCSSSKGQSSRCRTTGSLCEVYVPR